MPGVPASRLRRDRRDEERHEQLARVPRFAARCLHEPTEGPAYFVPERFAWRSEEWYRGFFTAKPLARHRGEVSPHYAIRHVYPGVAERMHAVLPDARIVYLVRDPIERIRSEWMHHVARGRISRSLAEEMRVPEASVVFATSRYAWQLEPYVEHYGPDRVLVLSSEQLTRDPSPVITRLLRFLEIEAEVPADLGTRRFNDSSEKRRPNAIGRRLLDHPRARRIPARTRAVGSRTADREAGLGSREPRAGRRTRCRTTSRRCGRSRASRSPSGACDPRW